MMEPTLVYDEDVYRQPVLKIIAKIVSYALHPLFIPTYIFLWLTLRFPINFDDITAAGLTFKTISVFLNASFFPAFAVFLLWRLKFIESMAPGDGFHNSRSNHYSSTIHSIQTHESKKRK